MLPNSILVVSYTAAQLVSIALSGYPASDVLGGFHATLLGLTCGPIDKPLTAAGLLIIAGGAAAGIMLHQADGARGVAGTRGAPGGLAAR